MQILGLLGMYFDAVVVEVKTFLLLFRLALAILCDAKPRILILMRTLLYRYRSSQPCISHYHIWILGNPASSM